MCSDPLDVTVRGGGGPVTECTPSTNLEAPVGAREVKAHTPRYSRSSNPASTRIFKWWDTVGWLTCKTP